MEFYSNQDIKAACAQGVRLAASTRVVFRLSDAPPEIVAYGDLPNYVSDSAIRGVATPEAERMVAARREDFRKVWGR